MPEYKGWPSVAVGDSWEGNNYFLRFYKHVVRDSRSIISRNEVQITSLQQLEDFMRT